MASITIPSDEPCSPSDLDSSSLIFTSSNDTLPLYNKSTPNTDAIELLPADQDARVQQNAVETAILSGEHHDPGKGDQDDRKSTWKRATLGIRIAFLVLWSIFLYVIVIWGYGHPDVRHYINCTLQTRLQRAVDILPGTILTTSITTTAIVFITWPAERISRPQTPRHRIINALVVACISMMIVCLLNVAFWDFLPLVPALHDPNYDCSTTASRTTTSYATTTATATTATVATVYVRAPLHTLYRYT